MSHAGENFLSVPSHLSLTPDREGDGRIGDPVRLPVLGQGTIGIAIAELRPFSVAIRSSAWGEPALRWEVGFQGIELHERIGGEWRRLPTMPNAAIEPTLPLGLDPEPTCSYWFSFDFHNRRLRYGKGEMRLGCMLVEFQLTLPDDGGDPYAWMGEARHVDVTATVRGSVDVWRDPVVADVPMRVVTHDAITMDMMAAGEATVPGNLTPTCRRLYDNVAGYAFRLDTPDFPDFSRAIEASIADPKGWCRTTLERKAGEFGAPDLKRTYLRITLGQNQGDSPGVPFVMEIWPSGHYSPIHNHGGAESVIKVLHGAIDVDLYRMLSPHHQQPFGTAVFKRDDVTWISGRLNQVHRLINRSAAEEACVTIQCYLYADVNDAHWPYFDYIATTDVAHFSPDSDAEYAAFKARMKDEWDQRAGVRTAAITDGGAQASRL